MDVSLACRYVARSSIPSICTIVKHSANTAISMTRPNKTDVTELKIKTEESIVGGGSLCDKEYSRRCRPRRGVAWPTIAISLRAIFFVDRNRALLRTVLRTQRTSNIRIVGPQQSRAPSQLAIVATLSPPFRRILFFSPENGRTGDIATFANCVSRVDYLPADLRVATRWATRQLLYSEIPASRKDHTFLTISSLSLVDVRDSCGLFSLADLSLILINLGYSEIMSHDPEAC